MSRYIDADALGIGKADRNAFTIPEYADGWNSAIEIINNAPTADVVEVVRCKDCKYSEFIYNSKKKGEPSVGHYVCTSRRCSTVAEGYCHWGERSEE